MGRPVSGSRRALSRASSSGAQLAGLAIGSLQPLLGVADPLEHRRGDAADLDIVAARAAHRLGAGGEVAAEILRLGAHGRDHVLKALDLHLGLGDQPLGLLERGGGHAGDGLRIATQRLDVAPGEADAAIGQRVHRPGERTIGVGEELIGESIVGRIGIQPLVYQKFPDAVVQATCGLGTACHPNGLGRDHRLNSSPEIWSRRHRPATPPRRAD